MLQYSYPKIGFATILIGLKSLGSYNCRASFLLIYISSPPEFSVFLFPKLITNTSCPSSPISVALYFLYSYLFAQTPLSISLLSRNDLILHVAPYCGDTLILYKLARFSGMNWIATAFCCLSKNRRAYSSDPISFNLCFSTKKVGNEK